jgi:hypothetical protein
LGEKPIRSAKGRGHPAESINDQQNSDDPVDVARAKNQVTEQNKMHSENDKAD